MLLEQLQQDLDSRFIASMIPHRGKMLLLEKITAWDKDSITCATTTHLDKHHPLRIENRLSMIHSIEYGAQAAAVHAALTVLTYTALFSPQKSQPELREAFLALVRDFNFVDEYLDSYQDTLTVKADQLMSSSVAWQYQIKCFAGDTLLSHGLITLTSQGQ